MTFWSILQSFLPLILIVALLYGVLWYLKKVGFGKNKKYANAVSIKVISHQMIMPKKYISIVKVDSKLLVLGVAENSINLIKELDSISENELQNNIAVPSNNNFLSILKKNMGI